MRISLDKPVRAGAQQLWDACASADGIMRWQADVASGNAIEDGRLRLEWPALGAKVELEVVAAEEPHRLVLRAGDSVLEMSFEEGRVSVVHEGFLPGDDSLGMESSWRASLAVLDHYLARHDGRDREVHWFVRSVPTSAQTAHTYFTEEAALRAWLCTAGAVGPEQLPVELDLVGGGRLSGTVLANTEGRDVVVSWREDGDSTLTLRTLPSPAGGERILCLVWSRWDPRPDTEEPRVRQLEAALERLARALQSGGEA